jgi:hypothetical protein
LLYSKLGLLQVYLLITGTSYGADRDEADDLESNYFRNSNEYRMKIIFSGIPCDDAMAIIKVDARVQHQDARDAAKLTIMPNSVKIPLLINYL